VASAGAVAEIAHRVGIEVPVIEAVGEIVSEQLTPDCCVAEAHGDHYES